jgi:hypothetical protein
VLPLPHTSNLTTKEETIVVSKMLEHECIHLCFPDLKVAICHSTVVSRLILVNWRDMNVDIDFFKRTNRSYIQNYYCEKCLTQLEIYIQVKQKEKYQIYEKS